MVRQGRVGGINRVCKDSPLFPVCGCHTESPADSLRGRHPSQPATDYFGVGSSCFLLCGVCDLVPWCFSVGADPRTGQFFLQVSPSMFWDFGSLHQKHRVGGTHGGVLRDGSDGWRSPVPRGDNTGGRDRLPPPPTITSSPADRFRTSCCLLLWTVYEIAGSFHPDGYDIVASFLTRCRSSRHFRHGDVSTCCRGTGQLNILAHRCFFSLTLRRRLPRAVAAGVSFPSSFSCPDTQQLMPPSSVVSFLFS